MKLVLTGATGFVGTRLLAALQCEASFSVHAAGRGLRFASRRDLAWTAVGELSPSTDWSGALQGAKVVVHSAARVHVMHDRAGDPLANFRHTNTGATLQLAQQAAKAGVARMVFLSSVKVNGEATLAGQAFHEAFAAAPTDPYAISKHEAEQGLRAIAAETGMEVVIIRPPLVYGPGVKANFASLMHAVARGWPLPLGALHNRRSLIALDNLVDFIMACTTHPAAANQTFLVSDGEDLSTTDLVRRLGQAMNRPARLMPVPAKLLTTTAGLLGRRAAAERLCGNLQVDISKARTLLGWAPSIGVDEGLRRAVAGMEAR